VQSTFTTSNIVFTSAEVTGREARTIHLEYNGTFRGQRANDAVEVDDHRNGRIKYGLAAFAHAGQPGWSESPTRKRTLTRSPKGDPPWVELVSYCLGVQLTDHIFDRICINNEAGSVSNQAEGGKTFPLSVFPIRQYDEVEIQQPSLARSRMRSLSLTHLACSSSCFSSSRSR